MTRRDLDRWHQWVARAAGILSLGLARPDTMTRDRLRSVLRALESTAAAIRVELEK